MILKKIATYTFLFFLTFVMVSLLSLPIYLDLILTVVIIFIFRKKIISIVIFNFFLVIMIVVTNLSFGKNEKHGYFYRAHEKYKTKQKGYQKNISDTIFMKHGDIYFIDGGLNKKRELIKEYREQKFVTDSHGMRNDINKIEDADIILVGDSFITANGTTQAHIPSNILSEISGKKVATLSYAGRGAKDYEALIDEYLSVIRKDAKIFVFYFGGNDFSKKHKKTLEPQEIGKKYIYWQGYKIPYLKAKVRFAYERLERNKDKFLLKFLSEKNFFLRNVRAKSHLFNRKILTNWTNTGSPIKYYKIGKEVLGFYYRDLFEENNNYTTYIFENKKVLQRVNSFFFIPTKLRIYSDYVNLNSDGLNNKFKYLKKSYLKLDKTVYDLTLPMSLSAPKYLSNGKYLYWKDDTHWNRNGIFVAMNYINSIIKK